MIATCKYHLGELDQAEADLSVLVCQESTSDQDAVRMCHVSHILSQIYLLRDQLEASELHCRNSMKGRRRLLGKEHKDYFASLGLLAEICNARGKHEEAAVFQDMIPAEIASQQKKLRKQDYIPKAPPVIASIPKAPELVPQSPLSSLADFKGFSRQTSVVSDDDEILLVSGSYGGNLRLWDVETGLMRGSLRFTNTIRLGCSFLSRFQGSCVAFFWIAGHLQFRTWVQKYKKDAKQIWRETVNVLENIVFIDYRRITMYVPRLSIDCIRHEKRRSSLRSHCGAISAGSSRIWPRQWSA